MTYNILIKQRVKPSKTQVQTTWIQNSLYGMYQVYGMYSFQSTQPVKLSKSAQLSHLCAFSDAVFTPISKIKK